MKIINAHIKKLLILYYDRTAVSEGIDFNETSASKESIMCHYWQFFR